MRRNLPNFGSTRAEVGPFCAEFGRFWFRLMLDRNRPTSAEFCPESRPNSARCRRPSGRPRSISAKLCQESANFGPSWGPAHFGTRSPKFGPSPGGGTRMIEQRRANDASDQPRRNRCCGPKGSKVHDATCCYVVFCCWVRMSRLAHDMARSWRLRRVAWDGGGGPALGTPQREGRAGKDLAGCGIAELRFG